MDAIEILWSQYNILIFICMSAFFLSHFHMQYIHINAIASILPRHRLLV
jgi:hypothetical protein